MVKPIGEPEREKEKENRNGKGRAILVSPRAPMTNAIGKLLDVTIELAGFIVWRA